MCAALVGAAARLKGRNSQRRGSVARQHACAMVMNVKHCVAHYHRQGHEGLTVRAFVLECCGRMDGDAVKVLKAVASVAGAHGKLSKRSAFLRGAYQEVNMALCRSNAAMYRKCNQQLAKVSGSMFQEGLKMPELPA
jgi:hypothetical protein